MTNESLSPPVLDDPAGRARSRAFRPAIALLAVFVGLSAVTEAVIVGVSVSGRPVDAGVWVRCSIVLAGAIVLLLLTRAAASGNRRALLRARIIAVIVVVAAAVIASIPGFLPVPVRIEQAACSLIMLPVAVLLNLPRLRTLPAQSGA